MAKAKGNTVSDGVRGKTVKKNAARKKRGAPKGNKNAVGNEGGAATKYKDEYADQAYKLCLLGYSDEELAVFFEVSKATINNWKKEHIEFLASVKAGKEIADAEVAVSFHKRAKGYDFDEVTYEKIIVDKDSVDDEEDIKLDMYKKKVVTKHLPPDGGSALNWLKNRQKEKWRDKIEHGLTNKDGEDVIQIFQIPDNGRSKNNSAARRVPDEGTQQPG